MFTAAQVFEIRKVIEFFLDGRNPVTNEATRTVNQFKVEGWVKKKSHSLHVHADFLNQLTVSQYKLAIDMIAAQIQAVIPVPDTSGAFRAEHVVHLHTKNHKDYNTIGYTFSMELTMK